MNVNRFLVFDIGCIECGQESRVVGFYASKKDAESAADAYASLDDDWGRPEWFGQHYVEVFDLEAIGAEQLESQR